MIFPEDLSRFILCLLPLAAFAILAWILLHLRAHWHIDGERSQVLLAATQRSLARSVAIGFAVFLALSITEIKDAFGLLSTLQGNLGRAHLISILVSLFWLFHALQAYTDPTSVMVLVAVLVAAPALYALGFGKRAIVPLGCTALIGWLLLHCYRFVLLPPDPPTVRQNWIVNQPQRGAALTPLPVVFGITGRQVSVSPEAPIYFAGNWLPVELAHGHFAIVGQSGSGKGLQFRLLAQSVLPRIAHGSAQRAVIFDAKQEMVSIVQGFIPEELILILNPFDRRCVRWDMAADFTTPTDAQQLSKLLLPDDQRDRDPFWSNAAREVIAAVVRAHLLAYRERRLACWTFTDIVRALKSLEAIRQALALHPDTSNALDSLREEKMLHGVIASVAQVYARFEVVAALFEARDLDHWVSLNEWMESSGGILILGTRAAGDEVMAPFNRLVIERITQLLLDAPEVDQAQTAGRSRTWFFLDELPRLGRIERLENLMTNARSKGGVFILGLQDVSDLRHLYGDHLAGSILGACEHKSFTQAPSPESGEFMEKNLGNEEVVQLSKTVSSSNGTAGGTTTSSHGESWTASEKTRPLFMKDELIHLGKPGVRIPLRQMPAWVHRFEHHWLLRALHSFFATSRFSPLRMVCIVQGHIYRTELPFTRVLDALAPAVGDNFLPRPIAEQFLQAHSDPKQTEPTPTAPPLDIRAALDAITRPEIKTRHQKS
ncbi:MAG: type IV secretion system DNA-binding domain-containing protein [Verrucomicrobiales bacterium]|nr:type IV secretion system DNA-binding domain-containing protein [Verrucomicrobiales bacterium]